MTHVGGPNSQPPRLSGRAAQEMSRPKCINNRLRKRALAHACLARCKSRSPAPLSSRVKGRQQTDLLQILSGIWC